MTQPEKSYMDLNPVALEVRYVRAGDGLMIAPDVFWDVVEVRESERHPGDVEIELVHGRKYTYAPSDRVTVLR